jgi:hypothetical protein
MFNIKNMIDLSYSSKHLDIRVLCMTPGENKCSKLQELVDISFPSHSIKVHDLSENCTSIGGGALPCVFSFVLNNTPKDSVNTVLADTDAIVVKNHWDSFIRHTLKEHCVAGISPRPSLGAVEWNWISFKSDAFRNKKEYTDHSIMADIRENIPNFKDWGQWWEFRAKMGGCTKVRLFPYMSTVFKAKSPVLVSDGQTPPNPFVVHMFYLSRRNNEKLADFGEDVAVITAEQEHWWWCAALRLLLRAE